MVRAFGEVSERPMELPWKGSVGAISPRVRIPPSPPIDFCITSGTLRNRRQAPLFTGIIQMLLCDRVSPNLRISSKYPNRLYCQFAGTLRKFSVIGGMNPFRAANQKLRNTRYVKESPPSPAVSGGYSAHRCVRKEDEETRISTKCLIPILRKFVNKCRKD